MTCREIAEFLGEYVEGGLDAAVRSEFDRHVRLCGDCLAYVESYRETVRLGKSVAEAGPGAVPEGLVRAILEARKKGK